MARRTLYRDITRQVKPWIAPVPTSAASNEMPRQVHLDVCAAIAAGLAKDGFRYLKSRQTCVRKRAVFTQSISFQSSHHNSSGRSVSLCMYANVDSAVLQQWRYEQCETDQKWGRAAGGMVHRLTERYAFAQWELADPSDRAATVADALTFIQAEVLPYLDSFEDPTDLVSRLMLDAIPAVDIISAVELAFCFGDRAMAQAVFDRQVLALGDRVTRWVRDAEGKPQATTTPRNGGFGEQIVWIRDRHQLQLNGQR